MRFIAQKLWMAGKLFLYSSILLLPIIAIAAHWYVIKNLAEPFHLGMIEWDLCTTIFAMAAWGELVSTGLIILLIAILIRSVVWLKLQISH